MIMYSDGQIIAMIAILFAIVVNVIAYFKSS